jgi:hypothetical protein
MERLSDGTATTEADATGVKKVATVEIGADGSIKPPAEMAAPESPAAAGAPPAGSDMEFPSMGGTLSGATPSAPVAEAAAPDAPVKVTPPKVTAKQVAAAVEPAIVKPSVSPTITNSVASPTTGTKPAAPPAKPKVTAAATPAAPKPDAEAAPAVTGAGYVAVLASVPVSDSSRMNALKQFADMQQKYASVLQNKMPDVKEANVADKGAYHRLVVGPPGSRESAQALCGSLKAAGYAQSCWVTAY